MAKARTIDKKILDLEKKIKELEAENAELKKQVQELQPKAVGYKGSPMKERYPTEETKKAEKKDAVSKVHKESKRKDKVLTEE